VAAMQALDVRLDTWLGNTHARISARHMEASKDFSRVEVFGNVRVVMDGIGQVSCKRFRLWEDGAKASCVGEVSVKIPLPENLRKEDLR
jgi:hypothetical protein